MDVTGLIKTRRTIRKFKQTPLSAEQLYKYIDAARLAPSAGNLQPLKYAALYTVEMTEKVFAFVRWAAYLAPEYDPKEDERPTAYIIICADETICKSGYEMDVGAAAENIVISAWADGVGSCIMRAIDFSEIAKLLNLPDNIKVSCAVALGYPAEEPKEVSVENGSIKYYLNSENRLSVPKRSLEEIIIA